MESAWYEGAGVPDGVHDLGDIFKIVHHWTTHGLGRIWFRGEARDYTDTRLTPTIARNGNDQFRPLAEGTVLTKQEDAAIRECQNRLAEAKFEDPFLAKFVPELRQEDVNWIVLAQHYRFPTRLLDITQNLLVATYFASSQHPHDDGYVYLFTEKTYRPQAKAIDDVLSHEIASGIPPTYEGFFNEASKFPRSTFGLLFRPLVPNSRMLAQHGAFIWWNPIGVPFPGQVIHLPVKAQAKSLILKALACMGIDHGSLFPCEPDHDRPPHAEGESVTPS